MGQYNTKTVSPAPTQTISNMANSINVDHKFILITSKMCGHCTSFKNRNLDSLKSSLTKINNIEYIEIETPTMDASNIKNFVNYPIPNNLSSMVRWFPYILMISSKNWQQGLTSDLTKDQVDAYNPQQGMSTENIIKWVNKTLQKEDYHSPSHLSKSHPSNSHPSNSYPTNMVINSQDIPSTNFQRPQSKIVDPISSDKRKFLPTYTSSSNRDSYNQSITKMSKGDGNINISGKIDTPKKPQAHYQINFVPRV